jgi:hypothetical protein
MDMANQVWEAIEQHDLRWALRTSRLQLHLTEGVTSFTPLSYEVLQHGFT